MIAKPTITTAPNGNMHVHIPMMIKRVQGRKKIIAPNGLDGERIHHSTSTCSPLALAVIRAHTWSKYLESSTTERISDLANTLEIDDSYVNRLLKLTTLAPDIIEAILNGEEPESLTLTRFMKAFPDEWDEQRLELGFN